MMDGPGSVSDRIQRLEDLEAIRQLVYGYAELCDQGYDPDGLAELFTKNAYWTAASPDGAVSFGEYRSREEIRAFFSGVSEVLGPMTLHYVMGPKIDLADDGKSAAGNWYTLVLATMRTEGAPGGQAVVIGATYEHEYQKVANKWLFSRIVTTMRFRTPIDQGWVRIPFVG